MKRYKIISTVVVLAAIICSVLFGFLFKCRSEEDKLIAQAMKAQKKLMQPVNTKPGIIKKFLDDFFDRPSDTDYWRSKYNGAIEELINKGYYKRDEITANKEKFNRAFKIMSKSPKYKIHKYSTGSFYAKDPNDPNMTFTVIGSIEDVDSQMKLLKEIIDSNESEIVPQ